MLHVLSANMYPLSISPPLALAHFSFPHPCYSLPAPCLLFSATLSHSGQAAKLAGPNSLSLKSMHITSFSPPVSLTKAYLICVWQKYSFQSGNLIVIVSPAVSTSSPLEWKTFRLNETIEQMALCDLDLNSYLILCVLVIHESTHTHTHLHAHPQTHTRNHLTLNHSYSICSHPQKVLWRLTL